MNRISNFNSRIDYLFPEKKINVLLILIIDIPTLYFV